MTAHDYLCQLHTIEVELGEAIERLEAMRSRATSISSMRYDADPVQTSTEDHSMDEIIRAVDYAAEINRKTEDRLKLRSMILHQIEGMDDDLYALILFSVYACGMKLGDIASQTGYSYRHMVRLYHEALNSFEHKYLHVIG